MADSMLDQVLIILVLVDLDAGHLGLELNLSRKRCSTAARKPQRVREEATSSDTKDLRSSVPQTKRASGRWSGRRCRRVDELPFGGRIR